MTAVPWETPCYKQNNSAYQLYLPVCLLTCLSILRHLVARILSSISSSGSVVSSARRARRDLSAIVKTEGAAAISSTHRRSRRSLDDVAPPTPSNDPPLLRVKRLEDEEEEEEEEERRREEGSYSNIATQLRPLAGLQRMKRIDTMATAEELNHGNQRRRRSAANYNPQILIEHVLEYMRE
ncbi:hypothetical protein LDENG_00086600 [Lucifuga dentata]|nr:hypothetical protein LDENG_00086600 [Lucifuga dentata]